ncbi:hypothetical protein BIW11_09916 [Tropilaelaps mercedesae]|uniref:Chromo domain-containing protein n=1 Tax=Tropilaelaps mercedesae TaxID=418985 RepID=A0A1V9XI01_9ACAR|nr:hypothetical protein BIW11_09916 [Tropilaelaps mercedesae]
MGATELAEVSTDITAHRINKSGAVSYLVLWTGLGVKNASWEPEAHLDSCALLVSQYNRDPRPNVTKTQILQEKKQTRQPVQYPPPKCEDEFTSMWTSKSVYRRKTPATYGAERNSDVLDASILTGSRHPLRAQQNEQQIFDTRAFFKLGFTASALIVLVFLLSTNSDDINIRKFLELRDFNMSAVNAP